jgi:hypothetical protein
LLFVSSASSFLSNSFISYLFKNTNLFSTS